jgi:signal transduction histidine kinase
MSASKFASGDPSSGATPARADLAAPEPGTDQALVQEKVLAEISHELGNFFHKLYYWSDYLQGEKGSRRSPDVTATQMLERTIKNFEGFIHTAFQYFHPIQLACVRMSVPELLSGLLAQLDEHLAAPGTPRTVADRGGWGDDAVLVDPGRLSHALGITVRRLCQHLGAESSVEITIARAERSDGAGVEIALELRQPNGASLLFQTAVAGVEWAVAARIIELHGGQLAEREDEHGVKRAVLFLPLITT